MNLMQAHTLASRRNSFMRMIQRDPWDLVVHRNIKEPGEVPYVSTFTATGLIADESVYGSDVSTSSILATEASISAGHSIIVVPYTSTSFLIRDQITATHRISGAVRKFVVDTPINRPDYKGAHVYE